MIPILYDTRKTFDSSGLGALYPAQGWKSGEFPEVIGRAMEGADSAISVWNGSRLVGLAAVLSDGHLVAYLSCLLVQPDYHGQGIGDGLMQRVVERYAHCLRKVLITFDEKGGTSAMDSAGGKAGPPSTGASVTRPTGLSSWR